MSFPRGTFSGSFARGPQAGESKGGPVLAVGRRVLVTCAGGRATGVTLTDGDGATPVATIADGAEVEILAWRPRRGGGTCYRVLCRSGGVEGWVGAAHLKAPVSVPAPRLPPPAVRAPAARSRRSVPAVAPTATRVRGGRKRQG